MAYLWHTTVRRALQQGQPASTTQARRDGSRAFQAGAGRSLNRRSSVRARRPPNTTGDALPHWFLATRRSISTATTYRNTNTAIYHPTRLCAALPYSATKIVAAARSSGRRGRRFKSCHPDQYSRRSEARTRNGEGLSCCAGSPKGTLRERQGMCSSGTCLTFRFRQVPDSPRTRFRLLRDTVPVPA